MLGPDLDPVALVNKTNKIPRSCHSYSGEGRMKIEDAGSSMLKGGRCEGKSE